MMFEPGVSLSAPGAEIRERPWSLSPEYLVGFTPAFRHRETGEIRLCRMTDGQMARYHRLDSLPREWIHEWDPDGRATTLVPTVQAGYLRGHEFWSLADMARPALDG